MNETGYPSLIARLSQWKNWGSPQRCRAVPTNTRLFEAFLLGEKEANIRRNPWEDGLYSLSLRLAKGGNGIALRLAQAEELKPIASPAAIACDRPHRQP